MKTPLDERLYITRVCREMQWDVDQYNAAPDWMIESLDIMHEAEVLHERTKPQPQQPRRRA